MLEKLARQLKNVESDMKDTKDRMGKKNLLCSEAHPAERSFVF
jgi:hypothetical protein